MAAPRCRLCATVLRDTFVDLGTTPLCEHYVSAEHYHEPEPVYPLRSYVCASCHLVQLEALLSPRDLERGIVRLALLHAPLPAQQLERVEAGMWCGAISLHFGHMIADFAMRIAASNRFDREIPLVFSVPPFRDPEPPSHFWQIIDHFGIERQRVLLVRTPTRFGQLYVVPQAERPFGGGPSRRHLNLMDAISGYGKAADLDLDCVFTSRAQLPGSTSKRG